MKKGSLRSSRLTHRHFRVLAAVLAVLSVSMMIAWPVLAAPPAPGILDPTTIPKYVNQLTGPPPVYNATLWLNPNTGVWEQNYTVSMRVFDQQILPPGTPVAPPGNPANPLTRVWGYGGLVQGQVAPFYSSPGPSFEAARGTPINVKWVNDVSVPHMFPVDPTLHWADPNGMGMPMPPFDPYPPGYPQAQSPVPLIPHLHGGEVQSYFDGHPDAWFTWDGIQGTAYSTYTSTYAGSPVLPDEAVFHYPNEQPPTTLWYHDHALGITRINVMSGLAGFYLLRDSADTVAPLLPNGTYEMPLVIQDRTFTADGQLWFPSVGLDPAVHPYWMPEFLGNTIMVNGLVWPNMDVDAGQYRFRLLDGSNARFYTISFLDRVTGTRLPFVQIGSDGGYLQTSAPLTQLTIAPGERADILVDFSGLPAGRTIQMLNSAKSPFPKGAPPDPRTVGQIMQFTVTGVAGFVPQTLPTQLNPYLTPTNPAMPWPTLPAATNARSLVLWEVMGPLGPTEILLNGQKWEAVLSETPVYHDVEEWVLVNPTADTHPIHLHLTQFQIVSRQMINTKKYVTDWIALNGGMMPPFPLNYVPLELPVAPYLVGKPSAAPPNEMGWKDTVQVNPGEVTVIRVRFEPIDGTVNYPFDPTAGPGYVWHCHILDHEDNEMMRPYMVLP